MADDLAPRLRVTIRSDGVGGFSLASLLMRYRTDFGDGLEKREHSLVVRDGDGQLLFEMPCRNHWGALRARNLLLRTANKLSDTEIARYNANAGRGWLTLVRKFGP